MAPLQQAEHLKPPGMGTREWQRSFARFDAALDLLGYKLLTTEDDFAALTGTISKKKVKVARKGSQEDHVAAIADLLSGNTALRTAEELAASRAKAGVKRQTKQPKGEAVNNNTERDAIDALHSLLNITAMLDWEHLWENRLADVAYKHIESPEDTFVPDQVKSARASQRGQLNFNTSIHAMVDNLEDGLSLTMIGMDAGGHPKKVWFLTPMVEVITGLKALPNITFQPKINSSSPVTTAMAAFAYDLDKPLEVVRLREAKLAFVTDAPVKRCLTFWNEDISQIPGATHWREMQSYAMTRAAVQLAGATWIKRAEDNYKSPDFWVNQSRVEDKVARKQHQTGLRFCMRNPGRLPYSPNAFDVLQASCVEDGAIYAIPMRTKQPDGSITSTLGQKLGKTTAYISTTDFAQYCYDLKDQNSVRAYVAACEAAAAVPQTPESP